MAALECLRDIGLEDELLNLSSSGDHHMVHTRWCHSMAGAEYARIYSWGNDPKRKGDYETASPCSPIDLPQTLLEPILVRHATKNGFSVRFNTFLTSFAVDNPQKGLITATVHDNLTNIAYKIQTDYLFGADGARSQVVKQLDLPLTKKPGQGLAINVLVKADLSHLVQYRTGNLHWVMQPDKNHPDFGWMAIVRMVKPWTEWMFILFPDRECSNARELNPGKQECLARVREFIGDETPAEILDVSKWVINETVAERFCLGDAVHRHPPLNGLGSNTCIQDAFNLAWKIAYVHRGLARPSLLDSFSEERQPVGQSVIARANQALRDHVQIWDALGLLSGDVSTRQEILRELESATAEGSERRRKLREGILHTAHEFHGLGVEMNQHYTSQAIYTADETYPYKLEGRAADDEVLYHEPGTYPGCRLPHVWLNKAVPTQPISTIDLAGHGAFILFTGIGGAQNWRDAAARVSTSLGVAIGVHSLGFRQDWEDVYYDWESVRGVQESGAVLVRPDRVVAWRAERVPGDGEACERKLRSVMDSVLGLSR
ncbi:hypothetical protein N7474_002600 [Penicillium riverlandense]|uniref:uncharacterized protein n=1 Tax=Penicillium riverlandense TaxID=1903569 RepID=UPI002547A22A|nr:uncharacterized protein N7474_002600 [Penicillium riverlandense]KAJ5825462.1 hypothetical protein N7474_002600 [Penicillium riverlandense]